MVRPMHIRSLEGDERVVGAGSDHVDGSVFDFWRWAFSDLCDNTLRGVFAEWLVGRLLGCELDVRIGWSVHDLTTPEGWRVEVKSGAYRQTWHTADSRESRISFGRMSSVAWDPELGYVGDAGLHADVYVFCVQGSRDLADFDALDLDQWSFHVVSRERLESEARARNLKLRSLSLSAIERLGHRCAAGNLRQTVASVMDSSS